MLFQKLVTCVQLSTAAVKIQRPNNKKILLNDHPKNQALSPEMLFFCDLSSWHGLSNNSQLCLKQFSFSWILRLQDFVQIRFLSAFSQVLRSIFTKVSALFSQNSSLYFPKTFQRNFPPNLNLISSVIHVCEICKLLYCSNAKFSLMAVRGKLLFQHPENREICQDIENYVKVFFNSFFIPLIGNSADKTSDRLLGSVELTN